MSKGTYVEFRDAMRAFESGWDQDRYATGNIQDWQLDEWAGGPVETFFPEYDSWGEMTDAQWAEMSYRSMNALGFVGYQFGEALLIDLGYYQDDVFYGNGASTNTWDGVWTGKNGVTSLEAFMTATAQEQAIQEAFGYNTKVIVEGLANAGQSLDDYLGTTRTYLDGGEEVTVTLTMTGILAAAHLRGAWGTLNLLLSDNVSTDEYGTSILYYMDQFGGYDSPDATAIIQVWDDSYAATTDSGSEGTGDTGDTGGSEGTGGTDGSEGTDGNGDGSEGTDAAEGSGGTDTSNGTAGVTKETADVVITWAYGADDQITGFDPANDTILIEWVSSDALDVADTDDGVVFSIPTNNQSTTLVGIALADLSAANFTILDDTAAVEVLSLVGSGSDGSDGPTDPDDTGTSFLVSFTAQDDVDTAPITTITGFDPDTDQIEFEAGYGADDFEITEMHGAVLLEVYPVSDLAAKVFSFEGLALSDLTLDNFVTDDQGVIDEVTAVLEGADGSGHSHTHMHVVLETATPYEPITGFMPDMGDVIEIGGSVSASEFLIFEETGDASGQTVRFELSDGDAVWQVIFTGFGLADLDISNFSIANEDVLNEVSAAIGYVDTAPIEGGYTLSYDTDGSNPADATDIAETGGQAYTADTNADDIVGFDAAIDALDFGATSVHGMIVTKSEAGEIVIDSPWSAAAQIVQGVTYQDVTIDNFGIVGNEHLRQDLGGVVSWEQGIGPRDADTVYLRSHEYGVHEVVDDFNPATMTLSFLYFGTRERLSVTDTDAGLVISSLPTGQSMTLTGVTLADLDPARVEFHHDQVMEDNLETPFGFDQNDVTLVDRTVLLTPEAPEGETTDGYQTRDGSGETDGETGGTETGTGPEIAFDEGADTFEFAWDYGTTTTITGFDTAEDTIDLGSFSPEQLLVTEADGDLIFEVVGNGGNFVVIDGLQAEDLLAQNLSVPDWSTALDADSALMQQLQALGFSDLA